MREGYAVQVLRWGEPILTIEHECLSGAELSEDDARAVFEAGAHLQSFAGDPDVPRQCFACGTETDIHHWSCPVGKLS